MTDKRTTRYTPDDPMIADIQRILRSTEPRTMPTETMTQDVYIREVLYRTNVGWKCPYCGVYCTRNDRSIYDRATKKLVSKVDYSGYNQHFAASHAEPFWKEKQIKKFIHKTVRSW